MQFQIDNDGFHNVTFEMNSGPEIRLGAQVIDNSSIPGATDITPTGGLNFRDQQSFMLNGTTFEFDSGPVLTVTGNGAQITSGDTFTVTDNEAAPNTTSVTFEMTNFAPGAGHIAVGYRSLTHRRKLAARIVTAIKWR